MLPHSRLLLALAALALSSTYALPAGNGVHEARRGRERRDSRQENRDNRQAEREARREQERREREERERQEREEREREEREREERRQERESQRQEREAEREREEQERQNARQDRRDARDQRQENRQENREERRENRVENGIGANIRSPKPPPSPPPPMSPPDNTPSTPPPYSYPTPYVHDVPTHVGQKVSYTNSGGGFAAMTGGMGVLKAMARQNVLEKLSHVGGNSGGNWLLTQLIWSDSFYTALTDTDRPISDYIKEWGDKYKVAMDDNAAEDREGAREGRRADRQERREERQEGREERRRERRGRISDIFPGKRVKEAGIRDRIQVTPPRPSLSPATPPDPRRSHILRSDGAVPGRPRACLRRTAARTAARTASARTRATTPTASAAFATATTTRSPRCASTA